jgi:hypothetical protein
MRKKVLTMDCPSCNKMIINDFNEFECNWGKGKDRKVMLPHKGKRPKECNLIRNNK